MREKTIPYSIASEESEEDNTFLSYNKVIGTSLDRELYLAFEILDYALLSGRAAEKSAHRRRDRERYYG